MKYLSLCDGIGAAHEASKELEWTCVGASEIAAFPSAVVRERHPEIRELGDMTKHENWNIEHPDLICGGTPCQSFSVAGLRGGLADPRGNLALVFLGIVDRHRPKWVVWENVPGVYSATSHNAPDPDPPGLPLDVVCDQDVVEPDAYDADEDHAFACFLAGLQELGYGVQYRTFNAEYFGLAQRRNRVFVVGYLGDWRPATAVLLEPEGMSGNPPPRRVAGKGSAATIASRTGGGGGLGTDFDLDGGLIQSTVPDVSSPLRSGSDSEAAHGKVNGTDRTTLIPEVTGPLVTRSTPKGHGAAGVNDQEVFSGHLIPEVANPLTARMHKGVNTTMDEGQTMVPVAFKMRGGGNGTGERGGAVGTQGGVGYLGQEECAFTLSTTEDQHVAVPFAFKPAHFTRDKDGAPADIAPPISREADKGDQEAVVCVPASLSLRTRDGVVSAELGEPEVANALRGSDGGRACEGAGAVFTGMAVRRLTPTECSRLQGFPDDYLTLDRDADAVEARSREVLRKLWCALGKEKNAIGGLGEYAPLLSPEILLAGMSIGWVSREVARWCVEGGGEISGANTWPEEALRIVRVATEPGSSPYRREPIEQLARELGRPVPVVPYETPSWGQSLLDTGVRQSAQGPQLLRQALSAFQAVGDRRGKPVADGPRYKALGNSWAVPNMRWIFRRIQKVDDILKRLANASL